MPDEQLTAFHVKVWLTGRGVQYQYSNTQRRLADVQRSCAFQLPSVRLTVLTDTFGEHTL